MTGITTYSNETANAGLVPPIRISDVAQRGRLKVLRNTIPLASQVFGATGLIYLGKLPAGSRFKGITVVSDTSLATSTISIGTVAGSYIDYKTAAVFTSVETPTAYGLVAKRAAAALSADLDLWLNILIANLPASGTLSVDIEYIES